MKLWDLFFSGSVKSDDNAPVRFGEALRRSFPLLCGGDAEVTAAIDECLADTRGYCLSHADALARRGLRYSADAEPWLQLVMAADALERAGYVRELSRDTGASAFRAAVEELLAASGLEFSTQRLVFDENGKIPGWAAQFNQYAGQSGITLYCIDVDSEGWLMGSVSLADYAAAAQWAQRGGIAVSCRF